MLPSSYVTTRKQMRFDWLIIILFFNIWSRGNSSKYFYPTRGPPIFNKHVHHHQTTKLNDFTVPLADICQEYYVSPVCQYSWTATATRHCTGTVACQSGYRRGCTSPHDSWESVSSSCVGSSHRNGKSASPSQQPIWNNQNNIFCHLYTFFM